MWPLLQQKSNNYYTTCVCICSLRYPGCNMHAPCCHLWPDPLYNIFQHYLNTAQFSTQVINKTMCFYFLYNFYLKHFSFSEELYELWWKMYIGLHAGYPLFLSDYNETWIMFTDFKKISKYQISPKFAWWELICSVRTPPSCITSTKNAMNSLWVFLPYWMLFYPHTHTQRHMHASTRAHAHTHNII